MSPFNHTRGEFVRVQYQGGLSATIDGVVDNSCAVEIESRTDKQIRGALVDLLSHSFPKKLLVIIPANMPNPQATIQHCEGILNSLKSPNELVRVVLLNGTGNEPNYEADILVIEDVLRDIGCL